MRIRVFLAALAALASGSAQAADLYDVPAPLFTPESTASSSWTGFYAGLHGGYGWAGDLSGVVAGDPATAADDRFFETDVDGALLGGQVGMNWQFDSIVLGVEGDASWSWISTDEKIPGFDEDVVDYLGSARVRAGVGFDRFLVYGTGGVGFAGINVAEGSDSDFDLGWAAGAGAEFLLTESVSIGGQYLHYGFGSDDNGRSARDSFDGSVDALTGRLNVKLGPLFR